MFWKRNETKSDPSRISVSGAVSVYSWGLCSNSNSVPISNWRTSWIPSRMPNSSWQRWKASSGQ